MFIPIWVIVLVVLWLVIAISQSQKEQTEREELQIKLEELEENLGYAQESPEIRVRRVQAYKESFPSVSAYYDYVAHVGEEEARRTAERWPLPEEMKTNT